MDIGMALLKKTSLKMLQPVAGYDQGAFGIIVKWQRLGGIWRPLKTIPL
jgi:hypothetical protein